MDRDLIERTFQAANWRPVHAASDFTALVGTLGTGSIPQKGSETSVPFWTDGRAGPAYRL